MARVGKLRLNKELDLPNILIPKWLDIERAFTVGKSGADLNISEFPEVKYPLSSSVLNEIKGEGSYGTIYLKRDGVRISHKGAEIYYFPHLIELMEDPVKMVKAMVNARKLAGPEAVIYAPALGKPNHLALLTYFGVDLFDGIPLSVAARKGKYLDENGEWDSNLSYEDLLRENYRSALRELDIIKRAIEERRLRDIVEMRVRSEPWLYAALRLADEDYWEHFEVFEPVRPKNVRYPGPECINRPEVMRFRKRVLERWMPRGDVLLLLPCSARKPYSKSRTHRKLRDVLQSVDGWGSVQEVIITSPLIMVPRELERFYPAGYYDAAVRGKWDSIEIDAIKEALENLKRMGAFRHVIIHLPEDMDFVSDAIHGEWTVSGSVTSEESLKNLRNALEDVLSGTEGAKERMLYTIQAMAEYQFGIGGEEMVDSVKGRWPELKGFKDGKQTVMFVEKKGSISLTAEGGRILHNSGKYRVFISDFEIHGDIFSVGVEDADPEIREGDDVVIVQKDEPVAVGIAERSSVEMLESKRGIAVRLRKKIR